ncbi:hypothetical protein EJF18_40157 [Clavispora lusitaniae]|uniref:Uncharacterized protein n=1 Tax=Clavispora lusitaniae TaxID=36911 RepID=A0ACD0WM40_CLALS|nr:hypothetical protein EJF14_40157 [Clavispora lusitaniae]QFZ33795.1 hypothetical protein EJF16_40157 [Clavispora lusitaniae]QFZ39479.1 hypothetical protein EJF15_40157 [Clavispora lusitaniae]QFZ45161.1 hypothetical protein EJF18_40157 [Clavispora lusitaniae]QFZ50825.1 hypothetical protein EJF17_40157 [Clavispora lusitaniae]
MSYSFETSCWLFSVCSLSNDSYSSSWRRDVLSDSKDFWEFFPTDVLPVSRAALLSSMREIPPLSSGVSKVSGGCLRMLGESERPMRLADTMGSVAQNKALKAFPCLPSWSIHSKSHSMKPRQASLMLAEVVRSNCCSINFKLYSFSSISSITKRVLEALGPSFIEFASFAFCNLACFEIRSFCRVSRMAIAPICTLSLS